VLQPELQWEPREALVDSGLHNELIRTSRTTWLVLEVGNGQAHDVAVAFEENGYRDVTITRDLAGIERVVEGRRIEHR
jgi:methylase of polypeptide subunit release factors